MISLDTETTSLYFKHGARTFAVGIYDGSKFFTANVPIDPLTRERATPFRQGVIKNIRDKFDAADIVCIHNANFDLKALADIGVIHIDEPSTPDFWEKIVDTTILSHLNLNTDPRSLKDLSRTYLSTDYASASDLSDIVNRCRTFVRARRPDWIIADETKRHSALKPFSDSATWNKMDMWLPGAVRCNFPVSELEDYFCYKGVGKRRQRMDFNIDTLRTCMLSYLKDDCYNTFTLAEGMMANVLELYGEETVALLEINNQVRHVVWKMEQGGITLHQKELDDAKNVCNEYILYLSKQCELQSGLTEFTPTALKKLLYEDWKLPILKKTKKGADSTDAKTLDYLKEKCDTEGNKQGGDFLCNLMALRKYTKKLEYLMSYERAAISHRIYPSMNIVGTKTLRFSSSDPNEQNISKVQNPYEDGFEDVSALLSASPHLRSVFGPPADSWWLSNDYSQLQLRIFAHITNDKDMIEKLHAGMDAHDIVARRIFGISDSDSPTKTQRRIAKNVNFGFLFGASPRKIEDTAGVKGLWDTVMEMLPTAHSFIEQIKQEIRNGECVRTVGNYPLSTPLQWNKWKGTMEPAAHSAVCYIIQGSEGVIVKKAMRLCDDYLTDYFPQGRIVMQVHDEISFEMPKRFPRKHAIALTKLMESAADHYGVYAPVNAEIVTHSWSKGISI